MSASTSPSYHVAGPIVPQCNIGAASAFVNLGTAQDGATINIRPLVKEIKSDGGGGPDGAPVEFIAKAALVTVNFRLVPYAGTYVNSLRAKSMAAGTDGQLPLPGTLFGQGGFLPKLYLPVNSTYEVDGPWLFDAVRVVNPGSNKTSTDESVLDFEFLAIVYFDPATHTSIAYSDAAQALYRRSTPP